MKTFLCVVIAIVMTLLVCIPIHFSWSKHIRADRFKTMQYLDDAHQEIYYMKGKEADRNRQPKWQPPKYRFLTEKGEKRR